VCGSLIIQNPASSHQFDLRLFHRIRTVNDGIVSLDFSSDGETIAIAYDRVVQIYSVHTGNVLTTTVLETEVEFWDDKYSSEDLNCILFVCLSTASGVFAVGTKSGLIQICDMHGRVKHRLDQQDRVIGLSISADGSYLASFAIDTVWVWDVDQGSQYSKISTPQETILLSGGIYLSTDSRVSVSLNNRMIAFYASASNSVLVYDTKTNECVRVLDLPKPIKRSGSAMQYRSVAISFLESRLIVSVLNEIDSQCFQIQWEYNISYREDDLIPIKSSKLSTRLISIPPRSYRNCSLSPDGRLVMFGSNLSNCEFWSMDGAEPCFLLCDPECRTLCTILNHSDANVFSSPGVIRKECNWGGRVIRKLLGLHA
jgi:hypothetical protein